MFLKNETKEKFKLFLSRYLFVGIYLFGILALSVLIFDFNYQPFANNSKFLKPTINYSTGIDYNYFYFAGMRASQGKNFYFPLNDRYPGETSYPFEYARFNYPPLMAYFFIPFSMLPLDVSFFVYNLVSILLLLLSVYFLSKLVQQKWPYFIITFLVFLFSPAFLLHLDRGQTNIEILLLVSLCLLFYLQGKYKISSFLLASSIVLKLMPIVFLPYFFIKNKKVFIYTIISLLFFVLIFGMNSFVDFWGVVSSFATSGIVAGGLSTGLGGIIYNRFTYNILNLQQAQLLTAIVGLIISGFFFGLFYKVNKIEKQNKDLMLLEFGTLMFLVSFLPTVSWLHNSLYYLFIFTVYWNLRPKIGFYCDLFIQLLLFLSLSQPLLFPVFDQQPFMTVFALRPVYMLTVVVLMWYFYIANNINLKPEFNLKNYTINNYQLYKLYLKIRLFLNRNSLISKKKISRYIGTNPVVIEIGAHVGSDTVEMATLWPNGKIYAFEPLPNTFARLKFKTKDFKNIEIIQNAVTDDKNVDQVEMFVSDNSGCSSSLLRPKEHLKYFPGVEFQGSVFVSAVLLDVWLTSNCVDKIDLLWIDAQGMEYRIFKSLGDKIKSIHFIYTEVSKKEFYDGAEDYDCLKKYLSNFGFELVEDDLVGKELMGNALFKNINW
ncbi:MAG: FkbM family methyltransferase [Candidatus Magasanikbacteria bacterium]